MIPVNIKKGNLLIRNIETRDLRVVLDCINEAEENFKTLGRNISLDYYELEQRYLESLMNSLEYFCGIYIEEKLIGIIKGRIENRAEEELWILSYLLLNEYRNKGIGTKALKAIEEFFHLNYAIDKYCILILDTNKKGLKFWMNNHYIISRKTNSLGLDKGREMIILDKQYK
jgi:RimJ/RimL family protein N-acetyltransferase